MDKGAKIEIAEERIEVSKAHCQLQSMVMSDIQNSRRIGERRDVGVGVVACLLAGLKNIHRSSCATFRTSRAAMRF